MVVRIVIAGESQCNLFAEVCLIADYLSQNLPNFHYERIEKPVLEWKVWLCKINQKNKWHHMGSPIIWKELLMKGSKPYYIGGAPDFFDYCHSYYEFDAFCASEKFESLVKNYAQYKKKIKQQAVNAVKATQNSLECVLGRQPKTNFVVCISGAGNPLTMHLISGLLEMSKGAKNISKIYIYDNNCTPEFMEYVERECDYISTFHSGKDVKHVDKIGIALTNTDLFIILDHVPFNIELGIGAWLHLNKKIMEDFAHMINASAPRNMYILFPNLGPACYNATILSNLVHNMDSANIVVTTSDLGLEIMYTAAEIAEVPMRNMFCPPVWGFVGVNHLVDIRTTIHRYNSFEPYSRYAKVKNSTLNIGSITPEMRTLEYLMYFDETLWNRIAEKKVQYKANQLVLNKSKAVLDLVNLWLFDPNPNYIVNLGVGCDGSFGLSLKGHFSQPAHLVNGKWTPASEYLLPKDSQMKLPYLEEMARIVMNLREGELPKLTPYYPCYCKPKYYHKKQVW